MGGRGVGGAIGVTLSTWSRPFAQLIKDFARGILRPAQASILNHQRLGTVGVPSTFSERVKMTSFAPAAITKSCADCPILLSWGGKPNSVRMLWFIHGSTLSSDGQTPSFSPPRIIRSARCSRASKGPQIARRGCLFQVGRTVTSRTTSLNKAS